MSKRVQDIDAFAMVYGEFNDLEEEDRYIAFKARLMRELAVDPTAQLGKGFSKHESVNHSADEWKRGEAHTNTIEGVFSVFKRGMIGTYQHCGEQHLKRYLAEFDFRYNNRAALEVNDSERARRALAGIEGKRLTYKTAD